MSFGLGPALAPSPAAAAGWRLTSSAAYCGSLVPIAAITPLISSSLTNVPWPRRIWLVPGERKSMSPLPRSRSAPHSSRTTRLSVRLATWNAIRAGRLLLIRPVITSTVGFCVARIRWMPTARLFWARRMMCCSISLPAVIIMSAISSAIMTMNGIVVGIAAASSGPGGSIRLRISSRPSWLYCVRWRTPTLASRA